MARELYDLTSLGDAMKSELVRSPATRRTLHAALAIEELKGEQHRGNLLEHVTLVDRSRNRPLQSVKDGGRITFADNARIADAVAFAFAWLERERRVPHGPAPEHYRDEHELFVNRVPVDRGHAIADDDFIVIANVMPYARKLETGHAGSPEYRVYRRLVGALKRKFGKGLDVRYRQWPLAPAMVRALVPRRPEIAGYLAEQYPMVTMGKMRARSDFG